MPVVDDRPAVLEVCSRKIYLCNWLNRSCSRRSRRRLNLRPALAPKPRSSPQGGGARRFRQHGGHATRETARSKAARACRRTGAALLATSSFSQWVQAVEIAGPGFLNVRLKTVAKQQVVREVLDAGEAYGRQPSTGEKVLVEFVSANLTGPLHRATAVRRRWVMPFAICAPRRGDAVYREFYYNDAGADPNARHQRADARQGPEAGRCRLAKRRKGCGFTTVTTSPTSPRTSRRRRLLKSDDRAFTASGDVDDVDSIREFAVAYPAGARPRSAGVRCALRQLLP